ncbi:hypothetical protein Gogos_011429 [Gossypium gossypioides]|uniref:Uncharacterized protein n=1 Tax=Gossypium gossypioides TaxID=34282 RepID=A0A7J9BPA4_GOSGO|nr:hypothetical protein [Gossypium gossypioides]
MSNPMEPLKSIQVILRQVVF